MNQPKTATLSKTARPRLGNKVSTQPPTFRERELYCRENDTLVDGFIHLTENSRCIAAEQHISTIARLAEDLQASVQAVWPRRYDFRYSHVEVLMISRAGDDLGVGKEVTESPRLHLALQRQNQTLNVH